MNRRKFLRSFAALAAVPAIPALAKSDGILWFQPWEVPGATLIGKTFTVDAALKIASGVTIRGCVFNFTKPVEWVIHIDKPVRDILITNTKFEVPPSWIISSGEIAL